MLKAFLLDLDGTMYHGTELVPGADVFVKKVREAGKKVLFLTNNATRTPAQVGERLRVLSVPCAAADVLTAAQVAATYIGKGKVYFVGEEGLRAALEEQGLEIGEDGATHVVVGLDRALTYEKLDRATKLIRGGAVFIATNRDKVILTEKGISPGGGAIVEALIAATGVEPLVMGKPKKEIVLEALKRLGVARDEAILVGDNIDTDILAGINAQVKTVLLLTGVTKREEIPKKGIQPTWVMEGFSELESLLPCL